jgi:TMEM175 potassium channel family protein
MREMQRFEDEEFVAADRGDQAYSRGRVLAISDGVFAFALTLLVVELAVPTANSGASLPSQLLDQAPSYFSYCLSFAVIALNWSGHHDAFRYIRRVDGRLIALNFLLLLLVAVLPFPTAVLGHHTTDAAAAVLYALAIALYGVSSAAMWRYATHERRLVDHDLPHEIVRRRFVLSLAVPAVFLASVPLAWWQPVAAEATWTAVWAVFFLGLRNHLR